MYMENWIIVSKNKKGYKYEVLDKLDGEEAGIKKVILLEHL